MRRTALLAVIAAIVIGALAAACGGGSSSSSKLTPIPGNSELVVGPNRFAVALIDKQTNPVLGTGDNAVHLRFTGPDGNVKGDQDATFVWAIPDETGFWVANVTFDTQGQWQGQAQVTQSGKKADVSFVFTVLEKGQVPAVGDPAPPTDNLTLKEEPNIKRISTDTKPDQAFYQLTVTEALQQQKPFVVIFATPAFCQTRFCGPMLDNVKAVRPDFAGVNFIHIEPYELDAKGALVTDAQGGPVAAVPTNDWKLQTEPWVFVVGADGKISSRFEGAASPDELRAAIQHVAGG